MPYILSRLWHRFDGRAEVVDVVQVAADGMLFIATARGLYALGAETGDERWVYATDLPRSTAPQPPDFATC
jgi:outer membrane protein assembly factor BamB